MRALRGGGIGWRSVDHWVANRSSDFNVQVPGGCLRTAHAVASIVTFVKATFKPFAFGHDLSHPLLCVSCFGRWLCWLAGSAWTSAPPRTLEACGKKHLPRPTLSLSLSPSSTIGYRSWSPPSESNNGEGTLSARRAGCSQQRSTSITWESIVPCAGVVL